MPRVKHSLTFHRPVPGAVRQAEGYRLAWTGTKVMGILNVTPDSFSDGGQFASLEAAVKQAYELLEAGAFILDIGGESTRPGAEPVPAEVELSRVLPVLELLAKTTDALISVDTSKAEVAAAALSRGAHLVNDVTGLRDKALREVCAHFGAPAVLMHMQGEPRSMQVEPQYPDDDVVGAVETFLRQQAGVALGEGVPSLLLDPGFGFGKTLAHNLSLVRNFRRFTGMGHPAMLGASRKATIGQLAGVAEPTGRDPGSVALHLHAAQQGAAVVRVHNVAAHVQALNVWEALGDA